MSTYISIYTGNPTKDMNDGTVVSENGSFTSPLTVTLNATKEEVKYIKCAVRCMSGYATVGDTVLSFEGASNDRWQLAIDNDYDEEQHIIKNVGTCPQCKRQFIFKEYFEYKGSIVEKEIKQR